jgi:hypothetical protein
LTVAKTTCVVHATKVNWLANFDLSVRIEITRLMHLNALLSAVVGGCGFGMRTYAPFFVQACYSFKDSIEWSVVTSARCQLEVSVLGTHYSLVENANVVSATKLNRVIVMHAFQFVPIFSDGLVIPAK